MDAIAISARLSRMQCGANVARDRADPLDIDLLPRLGASQPGGLVFPR
jgi:hypothetical protein